MNAVLELLKEIQGKTFVSEDGIEEPFHLLPPLTKEELVSLEARIPCPLPEEMREVLQFAQGFSSPFEVNFVGSPGGFGLEQVFPCGIDIAADGFGNFWVVDLILSSTSWGPIFYACHDAPVIVFQSETLEHFIKEIFRLETRPWKSEIDDVHEALSNRIWRQNPAVLSHSECLNSSDLELKAFAATLDESWQFIDLRSARIGDGFSWGRYGPKTRLARFGEKRMFAYQKKMWGKRFLDALR
jgi:hypothetical protein